MCVLIGLMTVFSMELKNISVYIWWCERFSGHKTSTSYGKDRARKKGIKRVRKTWRMKERDWTKWRINNDGQEEKKVKVSLKKVWFPSFPFHYLAQYLSYLLFLITLQPSSWLRIRGWLQVTKKFWSFIQKMKG